jgi:hypothetical protein
MQKGLNDHSCQQPAEALVRQTGIVHATARPHPGVELGDSPEAIGFSRRSLFRAHPGTDGHLREPLGMAWASGNPSSQNRPCRRSCAGTCERTARRLRRTLLAGGGEEKGKCPRARSFGRSQRNWQRSRLRGGGPLLCAPLWGQCSTANRRIQPSMSVCSLYSMPTPSGCRVIASQCSPLLTKLRCSVLRDGSQQSSWSTVRSGESGMRRAGACKPPSMCACSASPRPLQCAEGLRPRWSGCGTVSPGMCFWRWCDQPKVLVMGGTRLLRFVLFARSGRPLKRAQPEGHAARRH